MTTWPEVEATAETAVQHPAVEATKAEVPAEGPTELEEPIEEAPAVEDKPEAQEEKPPAAEVSVPEISPGKEIVEEAATVNISVVENPVEITVAAPEKKPAVNVVGPLILAEVAGGTPVSREVPTEIRAAWVSI